MKRRKLQPGSIGGNALSFIHNFFVNSDVLFRGKVCEETNWSIPTFYRKMRMLKNEEGNLFVSRLSNAEKDAIISQGEAVYEILGQLLKDQRANPPKKS
jgi:hypothetical protein